MWSSSVQTAKQSQFDWQKIVSNMVDYLEEQGEKYGNTKSGKNQCQPRKEGKWRERSKQVELVFAWKPSSLRSTGIPERTQFDRNKTERMASLLDSSTGFSGYLNSRPSNSQITENARNISFNLATVLTWQIQLLHKVATRPEKRTGRVYNQPEEYI
ncbi:hypothetical protein RUM44_002074 [Polyplax serrata]|uniref:Uncharacterized protein n=1 Tax=Polyplax serrata TaxID=468196 RepID=A0ABR1AMI3_POLSC